MEAQLRLQIEHECARLINIYCHAIDSHDVDRLLGLFAEDGVWQRPKSQPLKGRAEIKEFVEHHGVGAVSVHNVTNIVVDVEDEDHASSNAYAMVFRGPKTADGGPLPVPLPCLIVHYQHQFVRTNGQWYIKYKKIEWVFRRDDDCVTMKGIRY